MSSPSQKNPSKTRTRASSRGKTVRDRTTTPGEVWAEGGPGSTPVTVATGDAAPVPPEDWKERLAGEAEEKGSLVEAARGLNVPMSRVRAERRADRAFDAACREAERSIDEAIIDKVRVAAREGDVRAQALYFHRVRPLVVADESESDDGGLDLPPDVVAEMIRVGLAGTAGLGPSCDGGPPPSPGQALLPSRLRPQSPAGTTAVSKADRAGAAKAEAKAEARADGKAEKAKAEAKSRSGKAKAARTRAEATAGGTGEGPSASRGRGTVTPRPARREAPREAVLNAGFPLGWGAFLAPPRLPDATSGVGRVGAGRRCPSPCPAWPEPWAPARRAGVPGPLGAGWPGDFRSS